jgi:hypothetical protein
MSSSCVNEEIRTFNQTLMKVTKIFGHTSIMEVDSNREYYIKHGQHLNNLGKAKVSKQLSLQLSSVLQQKKDIPISLSWARITPIICMMGPRIKWRNHHPPPLLNKTTLHLEHQTG